VCERLFDSAWYHLNRLFSGLTVAASLCGLFVFAEPWLRSLGYGGVGVVLVGMLAAVTLVPALLGVLGGRIRPARPAAGHGFFYRVSRVVQRRARVLVPLLAGGLLALATPFLSRVELQNSWDDSLPRSSEPRQLHDTLRARFPGYATDPVLVLADRDARGPALAAYARQAGALPGAAAVRVEPLDARTSLVSVVPEGGAQGPVARRLVERLRALEPGFGTQVTGSAAVLIDYRASIAERLPLALGLIALVTLVLLWLMTGSLIVPLKAMVMAVLSLGAIALAVVLDATVVRTLLVPATMTLLGRWNWWAPRPLAVLHGHLGLRERTREPGPAGAAPSSRAARP
jgi:RND superfamily putative drug exporter